MTLRRVPTALSDVVLIEPTVYSDQRGFFFEMWQQARYAELGLPHEFVQDNISRSSRGILRGLHVQEPFGQGKLIQVIEGEVFDVAVDVRVGSPTFGESICERIAADNRYQLYVPPGFAHGFYVVSDFALFMYKCTDFYRPEAELSIAWNDPELAIEWPVVDPVLSKKDAAAPRLAQIPRDRLPKWTPSPLNR